MSRQNRAAIFRSCAHLNGAGERTNSQAWRIFEKHFWGVFRVLARVHQINLAKSDDVERVAKMASPISKRFYLNLQVRRGCATFPSAARGRTATDDGAAARIHRGTYQGLLAARTELGGEVEVVGYATSVIIWPAFAVPVQLSSTEFYSTVDPGHSPRMRHDQRVG